MRAQRPWPMLPIPLSLFATPDFPNMEKLPNEANFPAWPPQKNASIAKTVPSGTPSVPGIARTEPSGARALQAVWDAL